MRNIILISSLFDTLNKINFWKKKPFIIKVAQRIFKMAENKIHIKFLNWRYLFWSEHDETGKIERATLAGEERETIVTGAVWIPDMAVDTDSQTIYWIDIQRNTVEKCDYNGNNRKVVRRSKFTSITMSGITVFKVIAIKSYWDSCNIFTYMRLHIILYINNIYSFLRILQWSI